MEPDNRPIHERLAMMAQERIAMSNGWPEDRKYVLERLNHYDQHFNKLFSAVEEIKISVGRMEDGCQLARENQRRIDRHEGWGKILAGIGAAVAAAVGWLIKLRL